MQQYFYQGLIEAPRAFLGAIGAVLIGEKVSTKGLSRPPVFKTTDVAVSSPEPFTRSRSFS
jgi:hypothetical protein